MTPKQTTILDICYDKSCYRDGEKEIKFNPELSQYKHGEFPSWEYWEHDKLKDICPGFMTPDSLIEKYFRESQK